MVDPEPRDDPARMPRWVKVFALLILFVVVHLAGGGMHGNH